MAYTLAVRRAMVVGILKDANLQNNNEIFYFPKRESLDKSLITLKEVTAMPRSEVATDPVAAVFMHVLPDVFTVEEAENFIYFSICGGRMQGPKALHSANPFSVLSALHEEKPLLPEQAAQYAQQRFPELLHITI